MAARLVERLEAAARRAFAEAPASFAYLFGSHATGLAHAGSDVDVAVKLARTMPSEERLDLRLRLGSDLSAELREGEVDLVLLDEAPLPLRGRIVRDRIVVYSADEPARVAYESRTMREFVDYSLHADEPVRQALADIAAGLR